MEHPNFYENLNEAALRLRNCLILYDGVPHYVLAITPHEDGIFRVYMGEIGRPSRDGGLKWPTNLTEGYGWENPELRKELDKWLELNPKAGVYRKQINSPHFKKFRPFPLGMCNHEGRVYHLERQPLRPNTSQGLTRNMIVETPVTLSPLTGTIRGGMGIDFFGSSMRDCITGTYPSIGVSLENLKSGKYKNEGVGFHRNFAFLRGPIDMLFLAYKSDVIGVLPNGDLSQIVLGKEFNHCKEAVEDLRAFSRVTV